MGSGHAGCGRAMYSLCKQRQRPSSYAHAGSKSTTSKKGGGYKSWVNDLIHHYGKKHRKYLGSKSMSVHLYNNLAAQAALQGQSVWMTSTTNTISTITTTAGSTFAIYNNNSGTMPTQQAIMPHPYNNQLQGYGGAGGVGWNGIGVTPSGLGTPGVASTILERIFKVREDEACDIQLPDGSTIRVDSDGSYVVDDKDAKVVYRANRARDFNKFINVSDRIEEFFEFCGEQDVQAHEMMELPMKLFVGWLVLKAAETDKEEPPDNIKLIPDLRQRTGIPRCRSCARFIPFEMKKANMEFCDAVCFSRKLTTIHGKTNPTLPSLQTTALPPSTGADLQPLQAADNPAHEVALCSA